MTETAQNIGLPPSKPFVAGDHLNLQVTATNPAGTALDLTGAQTIKWQAFAYSKAVPSGAAVISKTLGSGITIINATSGRFDIGLVPGDTSALDGDYYHEAELTDAASKISTLFTGRMRVTKGFTA